MFLCGNELSCGSTFQEVNIHPRWLPNPRESSEIFKFQVDPLNLPKGFCLSAIQLKSTQLGMRPRTFPRCGIWGAKTPNVSWGNQNELVMSANSREGRWSGVFYKKLRV